MSYSLSQASHWTYDEYDCVYRKFPIFGVDFCAKEINRSIDTIENKARALGVSPYKEFTEQEIKVAKEYGKRLGQALMFLLPNRTSWEVSELLRRV